MALIQTNEITAVISSELETYSHDVLEKVNEAGLKSIKELVSKTKATAPVGKSATHFKDCITYKAESSGATGAKSYIWYVKPPKTGLTHLLVNGHQTVNGGRTKANPFLQNALDEILPQYQSAVEEAIRSG